MAAGFQGAATLRGPLVLVRRPRDQDAEVELALATLLAEREAMGVRDQFVTVSVRRREDTSWASRVCRWLSQHGRQPIGRLRCTPSSELVRALEVSGAVVVMALSHVTPQVQRGLLGPGASTVGELLLSAQGLRARGIPVVARLGPLLPGLHGSVPEGVAAFRSLLSHVRVADVREVEVVTGHLDGPRLECLSRHMGADARVELARAFGVSTGELLMLDGQGGISTGRRTMAPMVASVFSLEIKAAIKREHLTIRMAGEAATRQSEQLGRVYAPVHRALLAEPDGVLAMS